MKKQSWTLGLGISAGVSLIAIYPRLIRLDRFDAGFVIVSFLYGFFFCIFCWLFYQYLYNQTKLLKLRRHKVWVSVLSILLVGLVSLVYDRVFPFKTHETLQFYDVSGGRRVYLLFFRGMLVGGLIYFINYYLYVLSQKQKSEIEIERLKQAQLAANLSSLKEQLSPHFLFNTLNTLSTLTQEKPVKNYIAELANVYRYVLQYKEIDKATLEQELAFIESYLYIIKTRFEDAIEINIHVDESLMQSKIPPLTLQLLIENAIKHNIASAAKHLKIEITNAGKEYLIVSNNFQPKNSVQNSTGIGLSNVMQRYQLLFNREIIIEETATLFTIKLPIV